MAKFLMIGTFVLGTVAFGSLARAASYPTGSGWHLSGEDIPYGMREAIRKDFEGQEKIRRVKVRKAKRESDTSADRIYDAARSAQKVQEARDEEIRKLQYNKERADKDAQDAVSMIMQQYNIDMSGSSVTSKNPKEFLGQRITILISNAYACKYWSAGGVCGWAHREHTCPASVNCASR